MNVQANEFRRRNLLHHDLVDNIEQWESVQNSFFLEDFVDMHSSVSTLELLAAQQFSFDLVPLLSCTHERFSTLTIATSVKK